jgi:3-methyladenine DNA glycosylase AlkC
VSAPVHPSQRCEAPSGIRAGTPLKSLIGPGCVGLIAESFAAVVPGFDVASFAREACEGLDALELKPRAAHIAAALARRLSRDARVACRQLEAAMGSELSRTEKNGLAPFFYLPHSSFLHGHVVDLVAGLAACHALTRRFTAEFAIRPFLVREPQRSLEVIAGWTSDPSPHVRRLVSEGTRPRLPWAERLPAFVKDPSPLLPMLDRLVDDPEPYVRRSVANHVGDIAKDHPAVAFDLCRRWLEAATPLRRAVVRHAVRHPAKKGVVEALRLRRLAGGR